MQARYSRSILGVATVLVLERPTPMSESLSELHYTPQEVGELLATVARLCTCTLHDQAGTIECARHHSLSEQSELKRLLFARRMRERWLTGEFRVGIQAAAAHFQV
jgi:hypothetical protein